MFTQPVAVPGITSVVATNHALLYAEVLAHPSCPALPAITVATFATPCRNSALKAFAQALLGERKASVWVKGVYAVAFALQSASPSAAQQSAVRG